MSESSITLAAKCAPEASILDSVVEAGISAVELYTNSAWLEKIDSIVRTCEDYPLRYAVHAPPEGYEPDRITDLSERLGAEVCVFHNIYWEDEWEYITKNFKRLKCKVCVENMASAIEQNKYMRRFGVGRCLDLEHLIMEVNGIFDGPFLNIIRNSIHVHMTGYTLGVDDWHTHIHEYPEQSIRLLNLLREGGYSGFVVSEARESGQTLEKFRELRNFFEDWQA